MPILCLTEDEVTTIPPSTSLELNLNNAYDLTAEIKSQMLDFELHAKTVCLGIQLDSRVTRNDILSSSRITFTEIGKRI